MLKTVPVEEAVGMVLPHDVTEIIKDKKKVLPLKKVILSGMKILPI